MEMGLRGAVRPLIWAQSLLPRRPGGGEVAMGHQELQLPQEKAAHAFVGRTGCSDGPSTASFPRGAPAPVRTAMAAFPRTTSGLSDELGTQSRALWRCWPGRLKRPLLALPHQASAAKL